MSFFKSANVNSVWEKTIIVIDFWWMIFVSFMCLYSTQVTYRLVFPHVSVRETEESSDTWEKRAGSHHECHPPRWTARDHWATPDWVRLYQSASYLCFIMPFSVLSHNVLSSVTLDVCVFQAFSGASGEHEEICCGKRPVTVPAVWRSVWAAEISVRPLFGLLHGTNWSKSSKHYVLYPWHSHSLLFASTLSHFHVVTICGLMQ